MARFWTAVVTLVMLLVPATTRAGDLTLRDVIELHRSGLGDDVLIAVIQADGGPLALSYADIMDLKGYGLSERVIAALVRTGGRRVSEEALPGQAAVDVQQHVNVYAVPSVVVVAAPRPEDRHGRDDDRRRHDRGRDDAHRGRDHAQDVTRWDPPPAAWVTRPTDGRNVSSEGVVRTGKPPATWVTPNEIRTAPRGFHPGDSPDETKRSDASPAKGEDSRRRTPR